MSQPQNLAPSITLAQQAVDVYDQRGEFAMVTFVIVNMKPTEEPEHWIERGYCELDDGSDIVHQNEEYLLGWTDPNTGKQTHVLRPAAMPAEGRPAPINVAPAPVMRWPNRSHVWESLVNVVTARAGHNPDNGYAIPDADTAHRLAPSLHHAVTAAIAMTDTDRYVEKHVDNIARDIADRALELLQPQDLEALLEHARNA